MKLVTFFLDTKRSGKITQNYRSDYVDVDESTKLLNELFSPFESMDKHPNVSVRNNNIWAQNNSKNKDVVKIYVSFHNNTFLP